MPSTRVCSGSGMGVAQVRPKVPKLVTVAMEPPVASRGQLALARQFDQFVVALDQVRERLLVRVANHGHQHAILRFDGEADINGRRDARSCCRSSRPAGALFSASARASARKA